MKFLQRLGLSLSVLGMILYIPVTMNWLTLHFGERIGQFTGLVSFALGWALFGACLSFSAGKFYAHRKIKKEF